MTSENIKIPSRCFFLYSSRWGGAPGIPRKELWLTLYQTSNSCSGGMHCPKETKCTQCFCVHVVVTKDTPRWGCCVVLAMRNYGCVVFKSSFNFNKDFVLSSFSCKNFALLYVSFAWFWNPLLVTLAMNVNHESCQSNEKHRFIPLSLCNTRQIPLVQPPGFVPGHSERIVHRLSTIASGRNWRRWSEWLRLARWTPAVEKLHCLAFFTPFSAPAEQQLHGFEFSWVASQGFTHKRKFGR